IERRRLAERALRAQRRLDTGYGDRINSAGRAPICPFIGVRLGSIAVSADFVDCDRLPGVDPDIWAAGAFFTREWRDEAIALVELVAAIVVVAIRPTCRSKRGSQYHP